ncbi:hypothetical protein ALP75_200057 [Pseudomonas syringae pv. actinidiae]|nr:hypothetical protein ALP75_200057 [Pseudomonas syringae pv. actinidiae]
MHDVAAHYFQHRLERCKVLRRTANHKRQRPGLRAAGATRHWRVAQYDTLLRSYSGDVADRLRVDGAAINGRDAGRNPLQHAVVVQVHAAYMRSGRQHGDDQFTALSGLPG